jgi:hypothetical protein
MLTSDKGAEARSEPLDSIEDVLCRSAAAWNAGDLDGFFACPYTGHLVVWRGNRLKILWYRGDRMNLLSKRPKGGAQSCS